MVRPGRIEESIRRPSTAAALGELLEAALGALERPDRGLGRELRISQPDQPVADGIEAEVEIERARHRLEGGCEERRTTATTALRLTLAERQRLPEIEAGGEPGKTGGRDDGGASGAQIALIVVGMTGVERLGDGEVDHGVSEELEPFVVAGRGLTMFVMPTGMDERLIEQVQIPDREPDPCGEGLGGSHDPAVRPMTDSAYEARSSM